VYNHYTATHPGSPFVGQLVVLRTEPYAEHRLRGRELTTSRPDGPAESRLVAVDELTDVLAGTFGIDLGADEAAGLRRALGERAPGR
jgi:N-hydroxyarylamine O-acetyltransferase